LECRAIKLKLKKIQVIIVVVVDSRHLTPRHHRHQRYRIL